jgi:hypothetical protein
VPSYNSVRSCSSVFARTCLVIPVAVRVRLFLLEYARLYQCLFVFVCICYNMPGYTSDCSFSFVFAITCLVIPVTIRFRLYLL